MAKHYIQGSNGRLISFEFYNLDEVNELEITIKDDDSETYVNLSPKQVEGLIEFLSKKKHI